MSAVSFYTVNLMSGDGLGIARYILLFVE